MIQEMKSVIVFDPKDSDEQTVTKWMDWNRENKTSSVGDKAIPGVEATRRYLRQFDVS